MVAITNMLLLAATATAAVIRRDDADTIMTDFETINSDTVQLYRDASTYNGDLAKAYTLTQHAATVDSDLKVAIRDCGYADDLSKGDSQDIVNYISSTLEPNVKKAIKAIDSKKSRFQEQLLAQNVLAALNALQADAKALRSACSDTVEGSGAALSDVVDDIQDGIDYYSTA